MIKRTFTCFNCGHSLEVEQLNDYSLLRPTLCFCSKPSYLCLEIREDQILWDALVGLELYSWGVQ